MLSVASFFFVALAVLLDSLGPVHVTAEPKKLVINTTVGAVDSLFVTHAHGTEFLCQKLESMFLSAFVSVILVSLFFLNDFAFLIKYFLQTIPFLGDRCYYNLGDVTPV